MDKKKIKKMIIKYFLIILVLTVFSNSLSNIALPKVVAGEVKSNSLKYEIKTSGDITALKNVVIEGINAAKINNIMVSENQEVKEGQDIVELDKDSLDKLYVTTQNDLNVAKLDYDIAVLKKDEGTKEEQISYNQAKKKYDDSVMLYENGAISRDELEKSKTDLDLADMNLNNKAMQKNKENEKDLSNDKLTYENKKTEFERIKKIKNDNYYIKSPINGVVNNIYGTISTEMGENEKILDIKDKSSGFEVKIVVPNEDTKYLEIGEKFKITVPTLDNLEVESEIKGIMKDKDDGENKKEITFFLNNDSLVGNETANINIIKTSKKYDMIVPKSAIGEEQTGEKFVWKIKEEDKSFGKELHVEKALVTVIDSDLKSAAIGSGLAYGDKVVANAGELNLEENKRVIMK